MRINLTDPKLHNTIETATRNAMITGKSTWPVDHNGNITITAIRLDGAHRDKSVDSEIALYLEC